MQVLFDRVQPAATLTSKEAIDSLPNRASKIIDVDQLGPVDAASAEAFAAEMQASGVGDQIAFLQHSSGTTGHKKGVVLTHRQVLEQVRLYAAEIGVQAGDRIATWLPLYHDMGLITSFILPTVAGCPIVSLDAQEWVMRPTMLLDAIENEGANFCWLPNFAFLHIAKNDRGSLPRDLTSVKMFVNCSEPCRAAAFDTFLERYGPAGVTPERLQVSYAMAENVFAVTQTPAGSATRRLRISGGDYLSSGKALPGVQIELRDDKGAVAAPGEVGEICLRSTSMFKGYHHRPELTAERLVDGWYMTRDLGRIDGGELFVIGRTDDLVIVNGKNIVAHEVEDEIGSLAGVAPGRVLAAAVFNEGSGTSELIVLLERAVGSTVEAQVIEDAVRGTLFSSTSVSPSIVNVLPRGYLIKSSSGKLAREASINKWRESGFVSVVA
jgi:acyl-CoA synthetase (AMP-forming)/AMP-acid ligase II